MEGTTLFLSLGFDFLAGTRMVLFYSIWDKQKTFWLTQESLGSKGIIMVWNGGEVIGADGSGGREEQKLNMFHVTTMRPQEKHKTIILQSHGFKENSG